MARRKIEIAQHYDAVIEALTSGGLLLGSYDAAGKANIMTIGWAALGEIWGMGIWIVLVRPSRYTYQCIEHSGCFTVNVPRRSMGAACAVCGSKSGDIDKFAECSLTQVKSDSVEAPIVDECPIVYECTIVHSNDVLPDKLANEILTGPYVGGDLHRLYFGKVLAASAEPNAVELLKE